MAQVVRSTWWLSMANALADGTAERSVSIKASKLTRRLHRHLSVLCDIRR
jgi:hypothetical protein